MNEATPWAAMLRQAISVGVAPEAFWRLSLVEWRMLTEPAGTPSMARADFNRLTEMWPDE